MNAEQRQTATDLWTKPTDLSLWPTCRQLRNYIHHRHLLLLSRKADTQRRRLSRPRWLDTHPDGLPARKQSPIQVVTGPRVD